MLRVSCELVSILRTFHPRRGESEARSSSQVHSLVVCVRDPPAEPKGRDRRGERFPAPRATSEPGTCTTAASLTNITVRWIWVGGKQTRERHVRIVGVGSARGSAKTRGPATGECAYVDGLTWHRCSSSTSVVPRRWMFIHFSLSTMHGYYH